MICQICNSILINHKLPHLSNLINLICPNKHLQLSILNNKIVNYKFSIIYNNVKYIVEQYYNVDNKFYFSAKHKFKSHNYILNKKNKILLKRKNNSKLIISFNSNIPIIPISNNSLDLTNIIKKLLLYKLFS